MEKTIFNKVRSNSGFTLVELLITIAVVGILMTFSIIYVRGAYFKAKDVQAVYNVKQLQTALLLYFADNGHFPDGTVVMNVGGMCLTENGFEVCSEEGGTGYNPLINVAQAVESGHGLSTANKVYLKNIPLSTYSEADNIYSADQGGQWYTIFYKTKDAIKRAVPEDRKDSYPLASGEVRNWRIKTDLADIINMMNDFKNKNGSYPTIKSACFRNSKACLLTDGSYIESEEECNNIKKEKPNYIHYDFSTIANRGFLGDTNYCINNSRGGSFYLEYDMETIDGSDSSKTNVYKKHLRDLITDGSPVKTGSVFYKELEKNDQGVYFKRYWTAFFKNGMKQVTDSSHGN